MATAGDLIKKMRATGEKSLLGAYKKATNKKSSKSTKVADDFIAKIEDAAKKGTTVKIPLAKVPSQEQLRGALGIPEQEIQTSTGNAGLLIVAALGLYALSQK